LKYYARMREKFIYLKGLGLIARLGSGAFETIGGEVVNVCLQIMFNEVSDKHYGIDVSNQKSLMAKVDALKSEHVIKMEQLNQLDNPDSRIIFDSKPIKGEPLSKHADFGKGSVSGDSYNYLRKFWEFPNKTVNLKYWLNRPDGSCM